MGERGDNLQQRAPGSCDKDPALVVRAPPRVCSDSQSTLGLNPGRVREGTDAKDGWRQNEGGYESVRYTERKRGREGELLRVSERERRGVLWRRREADCCEI